MGYTIDRETYDALGDEATNLIIEQLGSKRASEIVLLSTGPVRSSALASRNEFGSVP